MEHGEQVHLLLSAPGQPPAPLVSPWRGWMPTTRGPVDLPTAAGSIRLSPVTPRAERALVAAVAADDIDALGRTSAQSGPFQDPARVLAGLRLAELDPPAAVDLLQQAAIAAIEPTGSKVLRKHWGDLLVQVNLAPSVPALMALSRAALALLAAELMIGIGRVGEALAILEALPPRPAVVLARSAALLAQGDHSRVLEATASLANADDVSALALVARSVAARSLQDLPAALDSVCEALAEGGRSPAVLAAALEERSHIYALAGDTVAAHADLEALAAMAGGQVDIAIPPPTSLRRTDGTDDEGDPLDRARHRIRRRITGMGAPGTFGGRHHRTYRDEIATMFALGQVDAVEELLLGLLDVVEDEVDEVGVALDPTFFLTLADLYQDSGRTEELVALRERYTAAEARSTRRAGVDLAKHETTDDDSDGGGEVSVTEAVSAEEEAITLAAVLAAPAPAPAPAPEPEPEAEPEPEPTPEPSIEPSIQAEAPEARPLTAVERAVRGPRVRSL